MTDLLTQTRDASHFATRGDRLGQSRETRPTPRLRVLYHVDLARIGAVSHPDAFFEQGEWLTVGRGAPLFSTPSPEDVYSPLTDPTISRSQLRIRWLRDEACFEVEPSSGAKRALRVVRLEAASAADEDIRGLTRIAPGACVAIDDRVLLGLEVTSEAHSIEDDRLGLVGESEVMWRLRRDIVEVARFRGPVLILGPTGAGKELVAEAIHRQAHGEGAPLLIVNCAALPEQLVESLLFGHVRGAFTGADGSREGLFRAAHGGTLFLDELGEMPTAIQPKLLRTLQDGHVTAVGQHRSVKVDVRLVAATNRDPAAEIEAGRLRADLYHRLSAQVIHVPSLEVRRLDVPGLFVDFLGRLRDEHPDLAWMWRDGPRWRAAIPLSFFVDLMRRAWDGNVRELSNVAEQAARRNLREGPFIAPPPGASASFVPAPAPRAPPRAAESQTPTLRPSPPVAPDARGSLETATSARLAEASRLLGAARKTIAKLFDPAALEAFFADESRACEDGPTRAARLRTRAREQLQTRLAAHDFNQARAAKTLGVSAWTLIRLMQDLGFSRPSDLTLSEIQRALDGAGGDLPTAAARLGISEHGLKKRLAEAGIDRR